VCGKCGEAPGGESGVVRKLKYCQLCLAQVYCSSECSHAHWTTHLPACKARRECLIRVNRKAATDALPAGMHTSSVNFNTGNATHEQAAGRKDEGNVGKMFTLKVGWCNAC